jgi:hypothetical protein
MSGKLPSLRKRLVKAEHMLAHLAKGESGAKCICQMVTVASPDRTEEFEAEMNRTCPVHGFRRLGMIVRVEFVGRERRVEENANLDQLLETYRARQFPTKPRLSQLRQAAIKLKHDSQEP